MAQITKIKHTDSDAGKCILISFRTMWNERRSKPHYSIDSFADFYPSTNCLTFYYHSSKDFFYFKSYKEALKYILSI